MDRCWDEEAVMEKPKEKRQGSEKMDDRRGRSESKREVLRSKGKRTGEKQRRRKPEDRVLCPGKRVEDAKRRSRIKERWWKFPSPGPPRENYGREVKGRRDES